MSTQGPNNPGTVADGGGSYAWTDLHLAKTEDGNYAYVSWQGTHTSNYIKATNFAFTIPTGATINGIVVECKRLDYAGTGISDSAVRIIKADGTIGTTDATLTVWPSSELTYVTKGSSTDLWGESWTAENINDADFGVAMKVTGQGGFKMPEQVGHIDHIRITIYYTAAVTSDIKAVSGVAQASISKIGGVTSAGIKKIGGVTNQ